MIEIPRAWQHENQAGAMQSMITVPPACHSAARFDCTHNRLGRMIKPSRSNRARDVIQPCQHNRSCSCTDGSRSRTQVSSQLSRNVRNVIFTDMTCKPGDGTLAIQGQGNDGSSYEITLSKQTRVHIPTLPGSWVYNP